MFEKRAVQVVLLNKKGEVLAVSRKNNHSDFGLVGGKVDPEDVDEIAAAIRETKEETGLDITNLRLVFAIHKYTRMQYTYLADWSGEIHYDEPHVVKWVPWTVVNNGTFGEFNMLVGKSLESMGIKFLKEEQPKEKYVYAISTSGVIHITRQKHWKKNKTKGLVMDKDGLEDLYNMCENANIMLHDFVASITDKEERFTLSKKISHDIPTVKDAHKLMKLAGFIKDKSFEKFINGN